MSRLLRSDLDELDAYVTRIAEATGIPSSHIEKDYWVTEVLRAHVDEMSTTPPGVLAIQYGGDGIGHIMERVATTTAGIILHTGPRPYPARRPPLRHPHLPHLEHGLTRDATASHSRRRKRRAHEIESSRASSAAPRTRRALGRCRLRSVRSITT